ncbi:MAG: hypothetical protein PHF83_05330 [Candidatus Methanomethylophilus sp.]|nr:hypothetical protein [Methanomethylophilus sp.]
MRKIRQLESAKKMAILLALHENGPMKKTDVYIAVNDKSNNSAKLDELENEGLIVMSRDPFDNNKTTVTLTLEGRAVARKLLEIEGVLSGELAASGAEMDYEPSSEQRDSVS